MNVEILRIKNEEYEQYTGRSIQVEGLTIYEEQIRI